jgi:NADH-quinone oxidoreductase subunit L
MPVTWITALIGSLALIAFPGFSGFFSKDAIIEAVAHSHVSGASFGWVLLTLGAFVTALYSFRMYYLVFHGSPRMDEHTRSHLHETPWVVTAPLVALAVPSVFIGWVSIEPLLISGWLGDAIYVKPENDTLHYLAEHWHGQVAFIQHGMMALPFWMAMAGLLLATVIWLFLHQRNPDIDAELKAKAGPLTRVLEDKYGFDDFNQKVFAGGGRGIGRLLWNTGDRHLIDGAVVNGSARFVGNLAGLMRQLQTGYLYHYAIAMIIGLVGLLTLFVAL